MYIVTMVQEDYDKALKRAYEDGYDSGKNQWQDDYGFTVPNKSIQSLERAAYTKGLKDKGGINKSVEYEEYKKGYEHGVQHMKMQNSIDRYLEISDKLSLTEDEVDNIIDDAFEEGYAQAYSELQSKTERERALQEKAFDEGYDQAIDDLIEAGVIGEEEYLDDDCSEYNFGDVEDAEDEEDYCFTKELEKVLNGIQEDSKTTVEREMVNHPEHYNSDLSGVECIKVARYRNFNVGSALKYLWRCGLKDGNSDIQDLEKAVWYLNDEIKRLKGYE